MAFGVSACAQDVGDIDRTQPNKVKKSIFQDDGEWYFEQTVVDTSVEGQSENNTYGGEDYRPIFTSQKNRRLKRIQWEIKENVLYAKATVEPVRGLTEQIDGEDHNQLGIVAAYPIDKHFDVQRRYNPQTGEPTNVIVENTSDREWDEREYMRVDWSTNLVTSFYSIGDGLGQLSPKKAAEKKREIPQDKAYSNPSRTRITDDYVETTTEFIFDPDVVACRSNFGVDSTFRCEGATAKVRSSFMKVPEEKTYKPMQYRDDEPLMKPNAEHVPMRQSRAIVGNGYSIARCNNETVNEQNRENYGAEPSELCSEASFSYFGRFGIFRTSMATWNEHYGTYDKGRKQWANRWNIWETMYDEQGNVLPAAERTPEPIVYHMNAGYPDEFVEEAQMVADSWNQAFMEAVRLAKGYESNEQVEQDLIDAGHQAGRMFRVVKNGCHPEKIAAWHDRQSAQPSDRRSVTKLFEEYAGGTTDLQSNLSEMAVAQRKQLCSELEWATNKRGESKHPFTWQRRGDLRHNMFSYVHDEVPWLGYGPMAADPKTGQIISATANFAGQFLKPLATDMTNILQYLNGDLTRREIEQGLYARRNLDGDGDLTEGQSAQELTPPEASKASQLARNDVTGPVKRLDVDEKLDRLNEVIKEGATGGLEDVGESIPHNVIERRADRAVATAAAANATDTKTMEFYEKPAVKQMLLSGPMASDTVNALAFERYGSSVMQTRGTDGESSGGTSGQTRDDARHQAYMDLYQPMVQEMQKERTQRMLAKNNIYSRKAGRQLGRGIALYTGAADYLKGDSRQKIRDFFHKRILFGTMLHEVGHTVGLRHNFKSSMDPMNYHDGFWQIQKLQTECPEDTDVEGCADGTLTKEEARAGGPELAELVNDNPYADFVNKSEFKTGSVMDYAPTGGNIAGLSKYDQSAINFAYAKHVQKWKDDVELSPIYTFTKTRAQYEQIPALLADENHGQASMACKDSQFDQEPDPECVKEGIDIILNGREWVSIEEAKQHKKAVLQNNTNLATGEGESDGVMTERLIDYEYCTDNFAGRRLNCATFDWGANQTEVLTYAFEKYRTMQPFNRYRGAEIGGFRGTVRDTRGELLDVLSRADTPFRYSSLYRALDYDLGALTDDLDVASRIGLNFYGEVLTRPKPGEYCANEQGDLSTPQSPRGVFGGKAMNVEGAYVTDDSFDESGTLGDKCEDDTTMNMDEGPAQFFGYEFSDDYNYRLDRAGTYIDKTTAAARVFQLSSDFAFTDYSTDLRATHLSYWTEFEEPLYSMLRSMFLGDYSNFGGAMTADGEFVPYKLVDPATGDDDAMPPISNGRRIKDPSSFDVRLSLILGAISQFSSWQDANTDFDEYTIIAASEHERQLLPDDLPTEDRAVFVHPNSQRKFVAIRAADGRSITYELVEWANELKDQLQTLRDAGETEAAAEVKEDMEFVVAKMNLIRKIRAQFSPEG
jgi:hypothetical protein